MVAVDELISLIEEMGAKEQSLFQLYDYLKHKLKLSIGGKMLILKTTNGEDDLIIKNGKYRVIGDILIDDNEIASINNSSWTHIENV